MLTTRIPRSCVRTPAMVALLLAFVSGVAQVQLPAPYNLRARPGDAQVELSWFYSAHGALTGFEMRYTTDPAALSSAAPPQWIVIAGPDDPREHLVSNLANGTRYYFQVRAIGDDVATLPDTVSVQLAAAPNEAVEIPDDELRFRLGVGKESKLYNKGG